MALLDELKTIVGAAHVLVDTDTAKYDHDWTGKYQATPIAVVRPCSTEEVSAVVKACAATKTPIVPVSGNTSLAGGTYGKDAVMVSMERMNDIREIRPDARIAIVGAGAVLSSIHEAADAHDLVFPLTFGAKGSAMIGGALSTNAGGSNVVKYGSTRGLCLGLEVVLPDGQIMNLMSELHKDNSGYDLKNLMIGAEGTLGFITSAVLKLFPKPRAYATAMVAVREMGDALTLLNDLQEATGGLVEAFEYMDALYISDHLDMYPKARAPFEDRHEINIMVEIGATAPNLTDLRDDGTLPLTELLENTLGAMLEDGRVLDASVAQNEAQRREMWERREAAGEVMLIRKPMINNDICVPVDKVATFFERIDEQLAEHDPGSLHTSVSHLGDGNIHFLLFPTKDDPAHIDRLTELVEDVTLGLGGSFSAEHGIGLTKKPSMARRKDRVALSVMHAVKAAIDPDNIMNPGKVLPQVN
ncbi:FAD/FMN-containing dehydrogenase [Litoreibacter ponti]|uniref:FAD/FMN-containing dehydrogenase n=1 Tax=Litoreibacter ponti TaxID=1510457 RepID=A0A2T6BFN2_9RHOB|nr:FAD-binding oxidoreductase [Litoreibacter ponti]PTX54859.1 FAD/FMN-containing dehydrogenase [Litoreibacter ponti]